MLDNLDELIELNLKLLYNAPNMYMWRIDFRNEKGQKIQDSLRFAKILDNEGLIDLEPVKMYRCELTKFGRDIVIGCGWVEYSESEKLKLEKAESKEILEFENIKLQKEASEYQKSIRSKEDEIRNLTRDNLRLGNWDIRFRWYIAVGGFIFGFIIKYFMDN